MQHFQIALVSEAAGLKTNDILPVAAALQKQVLRDFAPIWETSAQVSAFARLDQVEPGFWPVVIRDDLPVNQYGIHEDHNGQPFALVLHTEDWEMTASHEILEMLADPFARRTIASTSPKADQDRVEFLVEVCDPSGDTPYGYSVNGFALSDFYTPNYFDPVFSAGVRYSFTGAIGQPRQVLSNGYLTWRDPISDHWWQLRVDGNGGTNFIDLGPLQPRTGVTLRGAVDRMTVRANRVPIKKKKKITQKRTNIQRAATSNSTAWRKLIDELGKA